MASVVNAPSNFPSPFPSEGASTEAPTDKPVRPPLNIQKAEVDISNIFTVTFATSGANPISQETFNRVKDKELFEQSINIFIDGYYANIKDTVRIGDPTLTFWSSITQTELIATANDERGFLLIFQLDIAFKTLGGRYSPDDSEGMQTLATEFASEPFSQDQS